MYHIYQTEGFVLGSTAVGEANKRYVLFTRDMGLIHASAQGVRLLKSKLRHVLDDYRHMNLSLVRGKEFWRITNVRAREQPDRLPYSRLSTCARVFGLLRRLLAGEEKNEYLYDVIDSGFMLFQRNDIDPRALEILFVFKVLYTLGYIRPTEPLKEFLVSPKIEPYEIDNFLKYKTLTLRMINEALKESQL